MRSRLALTIVTPNKRKLADVILDCVLIKSLKQKFFPPPVLPALSMSFYLFKNVSRIAMW